MFIPLSPDYEDLELRETRPLMNLALLSLTIIVSVAAWQGALDLESWMIWRENPRALQFLTASFVHADWGHLIGNGICLYAFGNALNRRLGHARYLLLYLGLCVATGAGWLWVDGGQAALGASGVAMGLGGLFLVAFPRLPMNVLVPAMGYVFYAVFWAFALLALITGSARDVAFGAVAATLVVVILQLRYLFGVSTPVGGPREGYLLAFLGWRSWKLSGCWVAPALLVGDVIALTLGSADHVAHGTHVFVALVGLLVGLTASAAGGLRGTHAQPTLPEWVLGTAPPPPAPVRPRPTSYDPREPELARRVTRRATALSFSDWRNQQLQPVAAESGRQPRVY